MLDVVSTGVSKDVQEGFLGVTRGLQISSLRFLAPAGGSLVETGVVSGALGSL